MSNFTKTLLASSIVLAAGGIQAQEPMWSVSGNVALTSDYVWRGISQTMEDPAIQGGFDLNHGSGFYAGVWGSNVRFVEKDQPSDGAHIEMDLYTGFSNELPSGFTYDIGYIRYLFPGVDDGDSGEFYLGGSFKGLGLKYNYNPDDDGTHYYELAYEYNLPQDFTLKASVGRSATDGDDYTNYLVSAGKSWQGFDFTIAYTNTDIKDDKTADGRVVFTVGKSF